MTNNNLLDRELLIETVKEFQGHWLPKFLTKLFIGVYRSSKKQIDWRLFHRLDNSNRAIFYSILNMRNSGYSDEDLYQIEKELKRITGVK